MSFQVDCPSLASPIVKAAYPSTSIGESSEQIGRSAVSTRFVDFWLLGGASIVLWAVMQVGQLFRDRSDMVDNHFVQVGAVFALMQIFCNYPHFIISYRFGYGRGGGFIRRHWFALVVVPLSMIAAYALAYLKFDYQLTDLAWVSAVNHVFETAGLAFRLGTLDNMGTEILSFSVLLMNMTVGWHYSKQVFGCVMAYAHYDRYSVSRVQRGVLKGSLFSVAFLNFFSLASFSSDSTSNPLGKAFFFSVPLIPLGLPKFLVPLTAATTASFAVAVIVEIFYRNYRSTGRLPSANLIVPWLAFHVWWLPVWRQSEYYLWAIPFFHSLQYLPFAYRLEEHNFKKSRWPALKKSAFLAGLLLVGFCAFELIPNILDRTLETAWYLKTWFFTVAFIVFLNIHHFFIDSVVWKFDQKEVRAGLLGKSDS